MKRSNMNGYRIKQVCYGICCILLSLEVNAQLAKDKCKFLGNIIAGSVPTDFKNYWNQVTPENSGKWGSVEAIRDDMNWDQLDMAYDFAKDNGLPFRQHTFVWGQQQPAWMSTLNAEEQKAEVEEWIKAYCERYPLTDYIDVVNEPLHAVPNYSSALGGSGTTGWDWIVWTFEKAREYCPNAKLYINDYNIVSNDASTNNYLSIINVLKERDLIDGIGEQGHFMETTPVNTIEANLDKFFQTELPVHITEFDLNIASDSQQEAKYKELFPVLWEHPAVHGITLWGYRQGNIWREDAYLVRSNNTERPAMTWLKSYVAEDLGGFFCLSVGTEEINERKSSVYPNPAPRGAFSLVIDEAACEVLVSDLHGTIVRDLGRVERGTHSISMDAVPGIYFLHISGRDQRYEKLIIK